MSEGMDLVSDFTLSFQYLFSLFLKSVQERFALFQCWEGKRRRWVEVKGVGLLTFARCFVFVLLFYFQQEQLCVFYFLVREKALGRFGIRILVLLTVVVFYILVWCIRNLVVKSYSLHSFIVSTGANITLNLRPWDGLPLFLLDSSWRLKPSSLEIARMGTIDRGSRVAAWRTNFSIYPFEFEILGVLSV